MLTIIKANKARRFYVFVYIELHKKHKKANATRFLLLNMRKKKK